MTPLTAATSDSALDEPELTDYMRDLSVLTHKLQLSIDAENVPLAKFYLRETKVKLESVQTILPEYEGIFVALHIDRLMHPELEKLGKRLEIPDTKEGDFKAINQQFDTVLQRCNQCHELSDHSAIRVARNPINPYLQDFTVRKL